MATATAAPSAVVSLRHDGHVTKRTVRFTERISEQDHDPVEPDEAVIGTLYLPKTTWGQIGQPDQIKVEVSAA